MAGETHEAAKLPRLIKKLMSGDGKGVLYGLDTGFPELNKVTHGLGEGLYVMGGIPGCGKTTFAWQTAFQVAQKNEALVVFFSLDQSVDALRIRMLSRLSGIKSEEFYNGQLNKGGNAQEALMSTVEEHRSTLERLFLYGPTFDLHRWRPSDACNDEPDGIYGPPSLPSWFSAAITSMQNDTGTKKVLVVVDYLQKLFPLRKHGGDYERMNIVTDELRKLSGQIQGPVLAISELNREGYLNPGMDSYKNSGRIEYSADVACVLKNKGSKHSPREMELEVLKNRTGETVNIPFDFYPELAKFEEVK